MSLSVFFKCKKTIHGFVPALWVFIWGLMQTDQLLKATVTKLANVT
jgi:hypothetical protein